MSTKGKRMVARVQAAVLAAVTAISGIPITAAASDIKGPETVQTVQGEASISERELSFNEGWRFCLEDGASMDASGKGFDDSGWRQLNLPHDWSIELDFDPSSPAGANGGYLNGGVGWYRKSFVLPESMAGKQISIAFGGVYMDSTTYVNGELIGNYPYGYSPFSYDITEQVVADGVTENVIAVKVNNQQPSSRWYSGSGIYRNVNLVVTDKVHVERYGTYVTTPDLEQHYSNDEALVAIETKVGNDGDLPANAVVTSAIYDSEGNLFSAPVSTEAEEISSGDVITFEQTITTAKPELWSVDDPKLYELVSEVSIDGSVVDTYKTTFGFRWVEMDPNEGFYLNNEYMKLNGVCMHHDQGALGAVANYRAIERQMETMKAMGVNAIRVTHNPAADELLEICNKLGLLVIDEAFDCWESGKRSYDYGRFFSKAATHPDAEAGETWAEFDIKNMVDRGKNEPCIIMWSIGNEIVNPSVATAEKLVSWVAEVDSTRPATEGFNNFIDGFWNGGMKSVANVTGVVGFNYGEKSYDAAHSEYPDWIIMGSETSSAVSSRGHYKVDDERKIRSCYDDGNTVGWGLSAEAAWKANRDRKFVLGEFMWTGFDYIGEPSPYHDQYPAKSSYFGTVDTAGIPKDAYYIYQSQWTTAEENPMVHLLPHWNWENDDSIKKNGKIAVQAYSNAASVELLLNGVSLGEKAFEQKTTSDGRAYQEAADGHIYLEWQVDYVPGELKAIARDLEGNIIAEDVIQTADEPAQISLTPDREVITADGQDLSYILVEIQDSEGNLAPTADNNVIFQISGNGKIVGVDNGDPTEVTQSYKGTERKAYSGKAMVIVQSTADEGSFTLTASASGLRSAKTKVFTTDTVEKEQLLGYEEPETVYVKKGEHPVLPGTVIAVYGDQSKEEKHVIWDEIREDMLQKPGLFTVAGTVEGTGEQVNLRIIVTDYIGIQPVRIVTGVGTLPQMPETVCAVLNTGEEEELSVVWEEITQEQVKETGSFTVEGTVNGFAEMVTATVRVTNSVETDGADIARRNGTYPIPTASWVQPNGNDPVSAINNGTVVHTGGAAGQRWIPWRHGAKDEWAQIEFENPIQTGMVGLDFWNNYSDGAMGMPDYVTISYSADGVSWTEVQNQSIRDQEDLKAEEENIFTFDTITAKYIRWNFHNEAGLAAGVSEVHVYQKEKTLGSGSSAELIGLQADGVELEGFLPDKYFYTVELAYGSEIPQVTAQAEDSNASLFVVPAIGMGETTTVRVVSEDGKARNSYAIQFNEKLPVLDQAKIQMESDTLTEDDVKAISLTASLQDGTVLANSLLDVTYTVGNPDIAEIKDGNLYAYGAGRTTVKASVTYQGVTVESNELHLTINANPNPKVITGYEQITVVTSRGQAPELPEKVKATFDSGLPKQVQVIWESIEPEQYEKYGTFTVQGSVSGQELRPEAKVIVKGITGVQQFSCVTPLGVIPQLPEKAKVYYSDGTTDELTVTWDAHSQELFLQDGEIVTVKGTVTDQKYHGGIYETKTTVRVSSDVVNGDKFTGYKNGFYWPLGIASFTNGQGSSRDSASELNDNMISHEASDNNRWCNWNNTHREEDWAGIIFGLEEVTDKFIDNLEIDFYTDYGAEVPVEYTIEYYDGEYFNVPPADPDNVNDSHPTGIDANWKPVTNLQAPEQLSATETNYFTFDTVQTCAIRIRMRAAADKCLAITEMCAYEKLAKASSNPVISSISLDGDALEGFSQDQTEYTYQTMLDEMPEIIVKTEENSSVTVVYPDTFGKSAQVLVTAEDGVTSKMYSIVIEHTDVSELEEFVRRATDAAKKAAAAQTAAELAKDEAETARAEAVEKAAAAEAAQAEAAAAQAAAELAREKAEAAGTSAKNLAAAAEAAQKKAEAAQDAAVAANASAKAAQTKAEAAQTKAEASQTAAEAAQAYAEAAQTAAETAAQAANASAEEAQEAEIAAREAQRKAETAQAAAEAAQAAAEAAAQAADGLIREAETAQSKAEAAQKAAELAQAKAEEAQRAAEAAQAAAEMILQEAKEQVEKVKAELEKAQAAAQAAQKALEEFKAAQDLKSQTASIKKGDTEEAGGVIYRVTNAEKKQATAYGVTKSTVKTVKVADTVVINGVTCTVTSIAPKAFASLTKLKKVVIGTNITHIGKKAFYGDRRLKTIQVKATALKKVGRLSLKNISAKAVIKVPSAKKRDYKKLFAGKGQKKTVKIK